MRKIRKHIPTILLVSVFLVGLSLLLYPTVSDYWNQLRQTRAISNYMEEVADLDNDTYERLWAEAESYNNTLPERPDRMKPTEEEHAAYEALLDISGTGIMGYIEIPAINCSLPIYHGTEESVLQIAVGHIEGSSLPVGGSTTHCVLSGHRGLPSARLFTDLDKLTEGDTFLLHILDETLTYEVDKIQIIEPHEVDALRIEEGQDYCTLMTCTPYGVNSHRLLVRGRRIVTQEGPKTVRVTADARQIEPVIVAPVVAVPILMILLVWLLVRTGRKRQNSREDKRNTDIEE